MRSVRAITELCAIQHFSYMPRCRQELDYFLIIFLGQFKIKIYTDDDGKIKGDATVHYFKMESVELALKILDQSEFRPGVTILVTKAVWNCKGEYKDKKRKKLTPGNVNKQLPRIEKSHFLFVKIPSVVFFC